MFNHQASYQIRQNIKYDAIDNMRSSLIKMAFWNTGLYPPSTVARAKGTSDEKLLKAWFIVDHLLIKLKLDLFAICEISEAYINNLHKILSPKGFQIKHSTEADGNLIQDNALIYNTRIFELIEKKDIIKPHYSGRLKVGTLYKLKHIQGDLFNIYVCHWPSRLSRAENGIGRDDLGIAMRAEIEILTQEQGPLTKIVIMGDFNDEPFSEPLADKLMASRDMGLVTARKEFLYNPFWRKLGGLTSYEKGCEPGIPYGTYFYKGAKGNTKWHTFDQIIFSSSFVGSSDWHLRENDTIIHDEIIDQVIIGKALFDHLPVSAIVERE